MNSDSKHFQIYRLSWNSSEFWLVSHVKFTVILFDHSSTFKQWFFKQLGFKTFHYLIIVTKINRRKWISLKVSMPREHVILPNTKKDVLVNTVGDEFGKSERQVGAPLFVAWFSPIVKPKLIIAWIYMALVVEQTGKRINPAQCYDCLDEAGLGDV